MKSRSSSSYSTPLKNCQPVSCSSGQISSPTCKCAYPYTGVLKFRAPSFSDLENTTYYTTLEGSLTQSFQSHQLPVDSVSLSNPRKNLIEYLQLSLAIFPSGQDHFNWTGIYSLGFAFSNQTYKPPRGFEPYFFIANQYPNFAGDSIGSNKSTSIGIIIGAAVGGSVLLFLVLLAGVYAYRQKRKAERATDQNQNPFASWDPNKNNGSIPEVKGTRSFSFEDLSKYSNKFSDDIGSGGYGKVYRGTLPTGEQIAIKRAQQGSMQGGLEFKTEIELLSRVHHKNVVRLLGFCFQQGEQMLIYDYVPNGSLKDNLSGKSGMRLDWTRRLKIALGAARGLAYLHELADPPIIHRDVKSTNILLDEQLNARVADFGLSKLLFDSEKSHVTTQVKGTLFLIIAAVTNPEDAAILKSLKDIWSGLPPNWQGSDPCGDQWDGIECSRTRVITITLSSMGLSGSLSGDITGLSELQTLDLSYNKDLKESLPSSIGSLNKLTNLILVGCGLSGPIPDSIGQLQKLFFLSLNSNSFNGRIPASIGRLTSLYWLDLADNQLEGTIPVSDEVSPGLDMLVHTKYFYLGKNKLAGNIPEKLFSSDMVLIHVLFDSNQLTGPLPSSLGLVKTLEVVRFDRNFLSGTVPSNLNNLTNLEELFLSNNRLTGPVPNLTNLTTLNYLDMSYNTFDQSTIPSWFSTLQSLTTLMMEDTELQGEVPATIFSLSHLQTVNLNQNRLNGTLDIGASHSSQLQSIYLKINSITAFVDRPRANKDITIILSDNPICQESGYPKEYCTVFERGSSYTTPPKNCLPTSCSSGHISSPNCMCAYPYTGILHFRAPSFSGVGNETYYQKLEQTILVSFQSVKLPVDSVSLSNPRKSQSQYFEISLAVFPLGQDSFNQTGISRIGFVLGNQTYKPPKVFGPFFFIGDGYFTDFIPSPKKNRTGLIAGIVVGIGLLSLLSVIVVLWIVRRRNRPRDDYEVFLGIDAKPYTFSYFVLKIATEDFSPANKLGEGGFGAVYKGKLSDGRAIAVKQLSVASHQGKSQFVAEIVAISAVQHRNLVKLHGCCIEGSERLIVYEYLENKSLDQALFGETSLNFNWSSRYDICLGVARGLAYLHEESRLRIIHRDVKASNILLDSKLNPKISDFGLAKLYDDKKTHISTRVAGTIGYLAPEYAMRGHLTEKTDVFAFGVVALEIVSGRPNSDSSLDEEQMYLLEWAWNLHENNRQVELVDSRLLEFNEEEVKRMIGIALLCTQTLPSLRPPVSRVVAMLCGDIEVSTVTTKPRYLTDWKYDDTTTTSSDKST